MAFQLTVERTTAHAEQPRGNCLVAFDRFQFAEDVLPCDIHQRSRLPRRRKSLRSGGVAAGREALTDGVNGSLEVLVAGHENRLAVGADVAKRTQDVETCEVGSDQREDSAVVIDDE
jgi:hypothetical protein